MSLNGFKTLDRFLAFIQAGHQSQQHPENKNHPPIIFQWRKLAQDKAWMAEWLHMEWPQKPMLSV